MHKFFNSLTKLIIVIIFLFCGYWVFIGLPAHIIFSQHTFFEILRFSYLLVWSLINDLEKDHKLIAFFLVIIFVGVHWLILYILGKLYEYLKPLVGMIYKELIEFIDQIFPIK